jgi:hypothetical protein
MSKILLVDTISYLYPEGLIREGIDLNDPKLILKGIIQKADTQNGNGRVYRKDTLMREVEKYNLNNVKNGNALGELDHPDSSVISLANVGHKITKIWWEGNNVMGAIELLTTPAGNIARELIKCGVPLGISSRGMGSIRQIGETLEVGNDFELLCFDLVSIPSTPGAYLFPVDGSTSTDTTQSLHENMQPKNSFDSKYLNVNKLITDILCNR